MLFGHQNDDTNQSSQTSPVVDNATLNPLAVDPTTGASLPVATPGARPNDTEPSVLNQPITPDVPATPVLDASGPFSVPEPATPEPVIETPTVFASPEVTAPSAPSFEPTVETSEPAPSSVDNDLLQLKQQALEQLSPLVGQLDQTPEEKFRTTMMMIQSTDNQVLIKDAYEAAQQISDEKARAQALLDVVNEINYFTQQKAN